MTTLLLDGPGFYHCKEDEACFFWWMKRMPAFEDIKWNAAKGKFEMFLKGPIDHESLYMLIGLMSRYNLEMKSLKSLLHPEIEEYFMNEKMYWHEDIFGEESSET